ncbi:TonB-dependent receptor plug domain-containing protein [Allohahella sp. A8]|uniref:TonB-dependent receptor plug domain-containing protein n=1 Tax=Allohahella sp. A8 TaxID=3141461 RepID=UPI003A811A72
MSVFKNFHVIAWSGFSLCSSTAAFSAGSISAETELRRLEPVVVTANLKSQTVGESLSSVTVIEEADIERRQPLAFSELLRGQPGIDVSGNGSFGKATSVFTRGTGSESTVLLIDGVRVRSATAGSAPWTFIPPEMLERVEIVRGSRSSLYGADAVGGVVQAFTHTASGSPEGWVTLGAGDYDSTKLGAGLAGTHRRTSFSLAANQFRTDGVALIEGGDHKGYENNSGIARLGHIFENGFGADVMLFRAEGNTEFEGGETDFAVQTLGVTLDAPVTDRWLSRLQLAQSLDDSDNKLDGDEPSTFDTETNSARWENYIDFASHQIILGGEFAVDDVDSTTDYAESSRDNTAIFGMLLLDFGAPEVQVSLRTDDNEAYGRHNTGAIALGYALDDAHRLRTSYRTSFRAPTFNDLYFPDFGNATLEPETADAYEIGASGHYDTWYWDAAVYQNEVDNLIAFVSQGGVFAPYNVDEARIRGLELSTGAEFGDWAVKATASVMDPRDLGSDNRIRRRSGKQLRLDVDRDIGSVYLGATIKAQGYRYDDADNEDRIGGFTTLDLRAGWAFAQDWTTRLTVDNVLDKQYATAKRFDGVDYINAGRMALLTVQYEFR